MAFAQEQRAALHLLQGIENGTLSTSQASHIIDEADPALVYFIFTWLRARYENHPASEGVVGRLVELTQSFSGVKKAMAEGKEDSVVAWFEEEHSYKEFTAEQFIEVVVEKLEG